MSDVKNLYKLKQPVTKKFHIDGENNIDENCIDVGFQIFSIGAFEQYFERLDVESLTTQLKGHLSSFIVNVTEYVDLCDHAQNAEELNGIREHFNRCQDKHVAEILGLIGITTKEQK